MVYFHCGQAWGLARIRGVYVQFARPLRVRRVACLVARRRRALWFGPRRFLLRAVWLRRLGRRLGPFFVRRLAGSSGPAFIVLGFYGSMLGPFVGPEGEQEMYKEWLSLLGLRCPTRKDLLVVASDCIDRIWTTQAFRFGPVDSAAFSRLSNIREELEQLALDLEVR